VGVTERLFSGSIYLVLAKEIFWSLAKNRNKRLAVVITMRLKSSIDAMLLIYFVAIVMLASK